MADLFTLSDARRVLRDKSVVFLGDSIMRNIYQDFVTLLYAGQLTKHKEALRKKGEMIRQYHGDRLVNNTGKLNRSRNYKEEREMYMREIKLKGRFYFLTKCWSPELREYLSRIMREDRRPPDVIVVLSCLWDMNRWGKDGIRDYKENCQNLMNFFKTSCDTQVIWLTTPPVSPDPRGALLIDGVDNKSMRFNVLEGNRMAAVTVASMGFDVVDLHGWMLHQTHKRMPDGIHWTQDAVRFQINLILTHYCLSRDIKLPGRQDAAEGGRSGFLDCARKYADAANEGPEEIVRIDEVKNDPATKSKRKNEECDEDIQRNNILKKTKV